MVLIPSKRMVSSVMLGSSVVDFVNPIISHSSFAYHGHMIKSSGKMGIICAQAELRWVTIGPVPTP